MSDEAAGPERGRPPSSSGSGACVVSARSGAFLDRVSSVTSPSAGPTGPSAPQPPYGTQQPPNVAAPAAQQTPHAAAPDAAQPPSAGAPAAPDAAPPPHGTVAWAMGFLAYIPLPIVSMVIAGVTQLFVGLAQRKHGGLAAANGVRAANWGLTQLSWPVLMVIIMTIGITTGTPNPDGSI